MVQVLAILFSLIALTLSSSMLLSMGPEDRIAAQQRKREAQTGECALVPLDGQKIFQNYCAACHGVDGRGHGTASSALKTNPPDLTAIARRYGGTFPTTRIRTIIAGENVLTAHGSREMPIWGPVFHQIEYDQDLGYVRLQNVTEYLKSIQRK